MPSSIALIPSGGHHGATDTAAVSTAWATRVLAGACCSGPGNWYTNAPLAIPRWAGTGHRGRDQRGPLRGLPAGSVIHPVAAFSGSGVPSACRPSPGCGSRSRHSQRPSHAYQRGRDLLPWQRQWPGGAARLGHPGKRLRACVLPVRRRRWRRAVDEPLHVPANRQVGGSPAGQRRQHSQRPHPVRGHRRRGRGRSWLLLRIPDRRGT